MLLIQVQHKSTKLDNFSVKVNGENHNTFIKRVLCVLFPFKRKLLDVWTDIDNCSTI